MKNLIIILGGPERNLLERIRFSEENLPLDSSDVLFTGFTDEYKFFLANAWENLSSKDIRSVHSYDTWTNVKHAQSIWKEYEEIYIAIEKYHGFRTKKLFKILGRSDGINIYDTGGKEAINAKLLCILYSTRLSAWLMSIIARILHFNRQ